MSRRPYQWFAATGLLALAAATASAQPPPTARAVDTPNIPYAVDHPTPAAESRPNPWRGTAADTKPNPWRGTAVGTVPAPRAKHGRVAVELQLGWTPAGPTAGVTVAAHDTARPASEENQHLGHSSGLFVDHVARSGAEAPAPRPAQTARSGEPGSCPAPARGWQEKPLVIHHVGGPAFAPVPGRPVGPGGTPQPPYGTVMVVAAPASSAPATPTGTWYREMPGMVTAVTFAGDEAKVTLVLNHDGAIATATLTADYAVTKDGTVHGVITGADVEAGGKTDAAGMELAGLSLELQSYVDRPFAFRCRPTGGGLMVSSVRLGPAQDMPADALPLVAVLSGKFKPATGTLPTPKPAKLIPAVAVQGDWAPCPPTNTVLMPAGSSFPTPPCPVPAPPTAYVPQSSYPAPPAAYIPQSSYPAPPAAYIPPSSYPAPLVGDPVPSTAYPVLPGMGPAPVRTGPPPEVLETMTRAFGDMLGGPTPVPAYPPIPYANPFPPQAGLPYASSLPPQACLPPTPPSPHGAPCLTTAVSPTGYLAPPPPPPSPSRPVTPLRQSGQMPVGTWYREVGTMTFVVAVKDEHLTLTVSTTTESGDAIVTEGFILTADSYMTRDGNGLIGKITGVDAILTGETVKRSDTEEALDALAKLQKALTDKSFSFTFRMYDDTLVIANVQLPTGGDEGQDVLDAFGATAGQYKRSTGPLPKPRPATLLNQYSSDPNVRIQQLIEPQGSSAGPSLPAANTSTTAPAPREVIVAPMLPPAPLQSAAPGVELNADAGRALGTMLGGLVGAPTGNAIDPKTQEKDPQKLSLADVVELTRTKASDEVIVNQIRNTESTFKLSVADIKYLKANGVSDDVIVEMQGTPPPGPPPVRTRGGISFNRRGDPKV
ncbi:MAG: hypothetical protein JWO38_6372 [Gemmataceae bacterium]|nr:hypothetical protein [Gemmataceae bacterium]